jgi:hypothetical protein
MDHLKQCNRVRMRCQIVCILHTSNASGPVVLEILPYRNHKLVLPHTTTHTHACCSELPQQWVIGLELSRWSAICGACIVGMRGTASVRDILVCAACRCVGRGDDASCFLEAVIFAAEPAQSQGLPLGWQRNGTARSCVWGHQG